MSTKVELDLGQVREDVRALLENPSWDDGSLAPILVGRHTQYGLYRPLGGTHVFDKKYLVIFLLVLRPNLIRDPGFESFFRIGIDSNLFFKIRIRDSPMIRRIL